MSEALTKSETAKARKKGWLSILAGVRLSSFPQEKALVSPCDWP